MVFAFTLITCRSLKVKMQKSKSKSILFYLQIIKQRFFVGGKLEKMKLFFLHREIDRASDIER